MAGVDSEEEEDYESQSSSNEQEENDEEEVVNNSNFRGGHNLIPLGGTGKAILNAKKNRKSSSINSSSEAAPFDIENGDEEDMDDYGESIEEDLESKARTPLSMASAENGKAGTKFSSG